MVSKDEYGCSLNHFLIDDELLHYSYNLIARDCNISWWNMIGYGGVYHIQVNCMYNIIVVNVSPVGIFSLAPFRSSSPVIIACMNIKNCREWRTRLLRLNFSKHFPCNKVRNTQDHLSQMSFSFWHSFKGDMFVWMVLLMRYQWE